MANNNSEVFLLPEIPVPHKDFISYLNGQRVEDIQHSVAPYNQYEAKLREGFAQHRDHESLQDPKVNVVPIFNGNNEELRVRARATEDQSLNEKYIMPLNARDRKPEGSNAVVASIQDFKKNFNLFSESSLIDFDWSNVVAAGSSVVTALLPVPNKYNTSKKALREYYHQKLAPSSDVDLFIWGLDEDAALEKIKQIESNIRNAILEEVTTVRTKNAITIASHYPIRHVQIVLRLYKSVSEILAGFDVDCSCFAYDGNQVYGTPRAISAFVTQTNTIDLSRRSPSYESRLSKYARRGFEVYWPELDRTRVDPTIFERSFPRTVGLARLLVLEQLPKPNDREQYMLQRKEERGRPIDNRYWRRQDALPNNVKDQDPDDIAEWVYDDQISNYHSFTVPYGPKYTSKKIEKLLYTKDLLLNAEWNRKKERTVNLHRHPCFIGPVESVLQDCCGTCPEPVTEEEREVAKEEGKIYVNGDLAFMKDDPGRQTIGSFHPLTSDDWTEMAYIGNTEELCHKICEEDLDFVENWCKQNGDSRDSIDRRDHTGRTLLHLAAQSSTPEILKCLVDHGARIVARLVDGTTAIHIASARGNVEMVKTLLERSEENEAAEDEKQDLEKSMKPAGSSSAEESAQMDETEDEDSDIEMDDSSSDGDTAMTEGSFVKVGDQKQADEDALDGADDSDPDIYDVNVVSWDTPVSALHLAILGGHTELIKVLVDEFGADALLPVKLVDSCSRNRKAAIMTLILAARLSGSNNVDVTRELLVLGASSAQGDMKQVSAFHYLVAEKKIQLLKACFEEDGAASKTCLDHLILNDLSWRPNVDNPLTTAIRSGNSDLVTALLDFGAKPVIALEEFTAAYSSQKDNSLSFYWRIRGDEDVSVKWKKNTKQPVLLAAEHDMPEIIVRMLDMGADINTLSPSAHEAITRWEDDNETRLDGNSLLDVIKDRISALTSALEARLELPEPITVEDDQAYLAAADPRSYEHWYISKNIEVAKTVIEKWQNARTSKLDRENTREDKIKGLDRIRALLQQFVRVQDQLLQRGAKSVQDLHPEIRPVNNEDKSNKRSKKNSKPFDPQVLFHISGTKRASSDYLRLFEAAWVGDSDRVKQLTLAKWGPDKENNPLMVTVSDGKGFTPFAIAVFRRHHELAKTILGIADAQFKYPDEDSTKRRYTIADEDSDDESCDSDGDELDISSQLVDDTYTFDIAALRSSVGSKVSASGLLNRDADIWCLLDRPVEDAHKILGHSIDSKVEQELREGMNSSELYSSIVSKTNRSRPLGRYAIVSRDLDLLRFWLRCCQEASNMKSSSYTPSTHPLHSRDFDFTLRHGFIEEMGEFIRLSGTQLPLDALVKHSGVQDDEKPKYYQGLSIGGKKMTKWARGYGSDGYHQALLDCTPPLLQAAYQGVLVATEWFLSDTPFRLYREYASNGANDSRLKLLEKAPGGADQAIGSWLKQRSNLSLHAAVLSPADDDNAIPVLQYLLSMFPASIDSQSATASLTPLALAFLTGRTSAAELLISAGADQTTRDSTAKNLIHQSLIAMSNQSSIDVSKLRDLLALIDKRLITSLFTERCRDNPGGLTPLAYWLALMNHRYSSSRTKLVPEVFTVMLEFGGEEAVKMMDGSGQFPLHQAVKLSYTGLVKLMLEHDPALLVRENAMGQTPFELAESLYIRDCTKGNADIRPYKRRSLEDRVFHEEKDDEEENDVRKTWQLCRDCAKANPRPRKLISVSEAREVARRLAERNKANTERLERLERVNRGEESASDEKNDEVDGWLGGRRAVQML